MPKTSLHIMLTKFVNESRVLKECDSIHQKLNIKSYIFALFEKGLDTYVIKDYLTIQRFNLKTRGWSKKKFVQVIKYFECWIVMFRRAKKLTPDILHVHSLSALPIGISIAQKLNIPLIYDAHEYETETNGLKAGSLWKKAIMRIENHYIKKANAVVTVSEGIAAEYEKNYNIEKPAIIMNCPYYQTVKKHDLLRKEFNIPQDHIVFLYQGALLPGRGLIQMLEAFKEFKNQNKHLIVMGYGVLEQTVKDYSCETKNIHFKEAVTPNEVMIWTSSADIGISTIENTCLNHYYSLPNKLFEYFQAGIPVLVSDSFEQSKIVREFNVGWVLQDNTANGILKIIKNIDMGDIDKFKEGISIITKKYNWEEQEKTLINLYNSLLSN